MGNILTVTMTTYNRPYMVRCFLDEDAQIMHDLGIDFWIYDGSTNQETRDVVLDFINKGFDNIHYVYQDDEMVIKTLRDADMIELALHRRDLQAFFLGESKYIWFTGDKMIIKKELLRKIFTFLKENNADCFFLNEKDDGRITTYENCGEFFRDIGWLFTGWGHWIIKKNIANSIKKNIAYWYPKYAGTDFEVTYVTWEAFSNIQNFKAICWNIDFVKHVDNSPLSTCLASEHFEKVWLNAWIKANDALPDIYQPYVPEVIKDWGRHEGVFSTMGFLNQRKTGRLDRNIFERNKENYVRLSDCNIHLIKTIAYAPSWLVDLAYFCGKCIIKMKIICKIA